MKKLFTPLVIVALLLFSNHLTNAQTTLVAGDIVFTGYNAIPSSGTADTFKFVVLTPISSGTTIYFTERGYQGAAWQAFGSTEGTISWTSSTALSVGAEVLISGLSSPITMGTGSVNGTVAQVAGGNAVSGLSLSNAGDQIIAFQGGGGDPTTGGVTFIAGISWSLNCGTTTDAGWSASGCTYGPQTSAMPVGLTGGTNAFLAGTAGASPNNDHARFNCPGSPLSTASAIRAAVMNKSNWSFGGATFTTIYTLTNPCNYYSSCSNPTITGNPTTSTVCVNGNTTFSLTASGASGYQWQVNTGSGFGNITNGGVYSNATTATLTITGATAGMNGYQYRCVATNGACSSTSSSAALTVSNPVLTASSQTNIACNGGNTGAAAVNAATGGVGGYSYNWTPGNPTGDGTVSVTGLTAGSWTCVVTDANSCTAQVNFTVTQPPVLSLTTSLQTNVACNGGSTGAASVNTATGGAGGYTYNWSPGNPTGDGSRNVTGLTAGTWTCVVTDANSCTASVNFTVTQPPAISLTASSQTNLSCNGGSNGAASVNAATGGAGGYTYNWTPGNPTGDGTVSVTGLTASTWTCQVTDANSCTASVNFTVTQPPTLNLTASSQTNLSCNGGSNGAASVNAATGGAGGYTYNWTPGNPTGDGTVSVTGLTASTWTCVVTDANSCTAQVNFTVTQPPALNLTASSQTNISCNGGSNGAASVNTATGGAGGYTYNWTPGNPTGDGTVSVTGLTAGTWTCVVTDANACTASVNFTVTQPTALNLTASSQTNISCNGGSNGAASVNTATGGAGGYTYNWTPGNPTGDGTISVTGLTAGTWTCVVTDANACTASVNFTVTQPTALNLTASSQTNISCNGGSNGAASVNTATGGAGGYTYNWTPGNPTGDGTISVTGLTAGTWTCMVTDANTCTASVNFTVTQPTALNLTASSQTNISCNGGSNGAASVNTATGGAGGYTYNWTPGNPTGDGTVSVTGLTASTWTCVVTDANSCTAQVNFTVTQPPALNLTASSQTNISCNGGSNGAASVNTATGGAGGYTYNWTPGNPTGDGTVSVTGLTAGTWTCVVTDANACTAQVNFTVTQPPALNLTASSQTNISCNGGSNGAASVNAATGGAGGYTYNWTPGNPTGDGTVSVTGLTAGTWTCVVTDANTCTAQVNFTVTQPTALNLTASSQTNISCNGGSTGAASVNTATGGAGGYTYNWTPGNPTGDGTTSVTGLTAGTWTCVVTDANACTAQVNFTVTQPTALNLTAASQTNLSCNGGSNGAAAVNTATGGAGGYTYNWTPGNPTGDGTVSVTGLTAGTWTCVVTDANACTASVNFTVTQPTALNLTASSQTNVACNGGSTGAASVNTATGGAGGYTYNWTPGNPTGDGTTSVTGLTAGTWTCIVTDANACTASQTFNITVASDLSISAASQTNVSCNGGSNGAAAVNTATGGAGGYTYNWTPGNPTGDGTTSVTGLTAGTWTCEVTDNGGCTASVNFTVTQPTALNLTASSQTNISCNGGSTGAAAVNTATGGAGGYTYDWTPGNPTGDGTTSVTGLTAGTWTCVVTDANACTAQVNFTVTQPTALSLTAAAQTNVSCNGGSNGAASVNTATGGAGGYTYNWTPGNPTGDGTTSVTGLTAGTWTCIVTDANACTASVNFTVTQPPALNLTASSQTNVACNGGSTGAAAVNAATGGAGGYTYDWTPGNPTGDGTTSVTGLTAGTWTCVVTDANACTAQVNFTVTQPTVLNLTAASQTNVTCNGGADGAASVNTATGGAGGYTYNWTPGNPTGDGTTSVTGLTAGTWTCVVTDANNCTASVSISITEPTAVTTNTVVTPPTCAGSSDGSIDLQVSGGTQQLELQTDTFAFTGSEQLLIIPAGADSIEVNLYGAQGGTYYVGSTNYGGRTYGKFAVNTGDTVFVYVGGQPQTTAPGWNGGGAGEGAGRGGGGATDIRIGGNALTDRVMVAGGGGGGGFWSSLEVVGGKGGGLTGGNGYRAPDYATNPGGLGADQNGAGATGTCVSFFNTAMAGAFGVGGSPSGCGCEGYGGGGGWYGGAGSGNCRGGGGGSGYASAAVSGDSLEQGVNAGNGFAVITYFATAQYTVNWSTGDTTEDLTGLASGTYYVTVTDGNGCTKQDSVVLTAPAAIGLAITDTAVSCNGGSNGTADLTVSGGTTPYSYAWSTGAITEDIASLSAATYTVTVTDSIGCSATASTTITQPTLIVASTTVTWVKCNGGNDGMIDLTVSGGTTPYTFSWSNGDATEDLDSVTAGIYTATVTDNNGCITTISDTVFEPAALAAIVDSITHVSCFGDSTGAVLITVSGGTGTLDYLWSNGLTTEDVSGIPSGNYGVTITDGNGCVLALTGITVNQPSAALTIVLDSVTENLCNGTALGAAYVSVTGGTPAYSYNWSNALTTQDISGLTAGTYTLTVTDDNGCSATAIATLTDPSLLTVTVDSVTAILCNGASTGAVYTTATGGTGLYSYAWDNNNGTTDDIMALSAGSYTITVTDANGCTAVTSATVNQAPALSIVLDSVTNVLCKGNSTGEVFMTVTGATAPLSFSWSNGANTEDLSGVAAGIYVLTVTDGNNCVVVNTPVTVTEPAAVVSASAVATDADCFGSATGSIDLTPAGGVAPYTYAWSNSTTAEDAGLLLAGTYSVTVTDSNGCSTSASATVSQPTVLSGIVTATDVSCNTGNNGTLNLTVTGGTTPYNFVWSNAAITEDINTLTAGIYTVTITDNNGCTATVTGTVNEPTAISVTAVAIDVNCNSGTDGGVDVSVSGGTPGYTFVWSNSSITEDITGLTAGVYEVTVTDTLNCTATASTQVNEPTAIIAQTVATDVSCNGGSDGAVDLTVAGGTAGYTYLWNNSQTTQDIAALTIGVYEVTITDAHNCTFTIADTIDEPAALTISGTVADANCYGDSNGSIDISIAGGTLNYTYAWSNSATTEDINALTAGAYDVTVTDNKGCIITASYTVNEPTALTITNVVTDVNCNGGNDGAVDITVTGGVLPYVYSWSNSATTEDISNIVAGNYTPIVTDAHNCTVTSAAIVVAEPTLITVTIDSVTDANCNGESNGAVYVTANGGVPGYTYSWSNSTTNEDVMGVAAGTYTVVVTDNHGCTMSSSVATVAEPTVLTAATDSTRMPLCNGGTDGGLYITASGSVAPYTYSWSNNATTEDISPVAAGSYTVTVTDSHGCTTVYTETVSEPSAIVVTATATGVNCDGGADGSIDLSVTGGTPGYTYLWTGGETTEDITALVEGNYIPLVTDNNGCSDTIHVYVGVQHQNPVVNLGPAILQCGSAILDAGNPGSTYLWNDNSTAQTLTITANGTYYVSLTDVNGCKGSDTVTAVIYPLPTATLAVANDTVCSNSAPVVLTGLPTGGAYQGLGVNGTSFAPTVAGAGLHTVTYVYTDNNGCVDTAYVEMVVEICTGLEDVTAGIQVQVMPNPNNGTFTVRSENAKPITAFVMNELGQQVYNFTLNQNNNYTHTVTNLAQGVYFVVANVSNQIISRKVIVVN